MPGLLVGALGDGEPLQADRLPGVVHHGEHVGQALVGLANQVADGVGEFHHTGRAAVDAELVLDGQALDCIALARLAVGVEQELGRDEERDALHTRGGIGQPGQDQVHDVVGHRVIAPGDEDLLAADPVVVTLRSGPGLDRGQVRAGLRLGDVHGPGPLAGGHLG